MKGEAVALADGEDLLKGLRVLYVEDDDSSRTLLTRFLSRRVGALFVATNGREGVDLFRAEQPDLVITDIRMPVMDGLEMARVIKAACAEVPIIVVTAYSERDYFMRAIEIGVDRYVTKPVDTALLVRAISESTRTRLHHRQMEEARQAIVDVLTQVIAVLSRAFEVRDPYTDGHQKRVSALAVAIAAEMGLDVDRITGIKLGSLVHDVGKMGVPAELLSSPRKLSAVEMGMIRSHPVAGYNILSETKFPWPVGQMVVQHHERLDGSGYPEGLCGDEICLEARIIAVADVVEAMTAHRPYRPALGVEAAIAEVGKNRGVLYDAEVVDACIRVLHRRGFKFWD